MTFMIQLKPRRSGTNVLFVINTSIISKFNKTKVFTNGLCIKDEVLKH